MLGEHLCGGLGRVGRLLCGAMSLSMLGQKYDCNNHSFIFAMPSCPASNALCISWVRLSMCAAGAIRSVRAGAMAVQSAPEDAVLKEAQRSKLGEVHCLALVPWQLGFLQKFNNGVGKFIARLQKREFRGENLDFLLNIST